MAAGEAVEVRVDDGLGRFGGGGRKSCQANDSCQLLQQTSRVVLRVNWAHIVRDQGGVVPQNTRREPTRALVTPPSRRPGPRRPVARTTAAAAAPSSAWPRGHEVHQRQPGAARCALSSAAGTVTGNGTPTSIGRRRSGRFPFVG